jgi:ferric-dicitrate binding protein FerR (iron transport regulator)
MNHLIDKYRKDGLTPEELSELKTKVNVMADDELGRLIQRNWMENDADADSVDSGVEKRMKNKIDAAIGDKYPRIPLWMRWGQLAAAVLLLVSVLCAVYFYRENRLVLSQQMVVMTGKAERASVALPDGTVVCLNAESTLEYHPKTYNAKERRVHFKGEGYFQVFRNENPFFVYAKGLQITVLGTVFNLSVREKNAVAELTLEKGRVSLLSVLSNRSVVLTENQKAIVNQATGDITVITDECVGEVSAWRRGDMVFRNTELSAVVRAIEENYNVTVYVDCRECLTDLFTGTLPVNELNEALEIMEQTYHLTAVIDGKIIVVKSK